jgi:predicted AlkP superfamily phosphohydrolase/phosphomutase
MFYRHLPSENGNGNDGVPSQYAGVIEDMYRRMDDLVGLALKHTDDQTTLFVLSDHGFCGFRRGINLNTWLRQNGYLVLKDGAIEGEPYFRGVDWSRTKAYTMGLGGLYLNVKGREASGIVQPGAEAAALKKELMEKLTGLMDDEHNTEAIRSVYAASAIYRGPYLEHAPDLIIGYNDGYRTSWDAAVGKVSANVFEDNCKAWSGDHSVDPLLVPGVLFCNRKTDVQDPGIEDMAPTALALFGLDPPQWMEGKPLWGHAA